MLPRERPIPESPGGEQGEDVSLLLAGLVLCSSVKTTSRSMVGSPVIGKVEAVRKETKTLLIDFDRSIEEPQSFHSITCSPLSGGIFMLNTSCSISVTVEV